MAEFDPTNTTVAEIHDRICTQAVDVANYQIANDTAIPRKYRGGAVLRNGSPYNGGALTLEITEEYQGVPDKWKAIYRGYATSALKAAMIGNQELFVGMIFGEARAGRNYFGRWQQAPTTLFD
jgi:hypothetical protein